MLSNNGDNRLQLTARDKYALLARIHVKLRDHFHACYFAYFHQSQTL